MLPVMKERSKKSITMERLGVVTREALARGAPEQDPELFTFGSYPWNRSKYLVLVTVYQRGSRTPALLWDLLVYSGVAWNSVYNGLTKWKRWRYLSEYKGHYRLGVKGRAFISKMGEHLPGVVKCWLAEQKDWRSRLPPREHLETLTMGQLRLTLENLREHRVGSVAWLLHRSEYWRKNGKDK